MMPDARSRGRIRTGRSPDSLVRLGILSGVFLVGAFGGLFFALLGGSHQALAESLLIYFQGLAQSGSGDISVLPAVWDVFRWPALSFVLGYTALGIAGIPVLLCMRGFLLTYSSAAFMQMFGAEGLSASVIFFGVAGLLTVPVMFAVSTYSFRAALLRRFGGDEPGQTWIGMGALAPCTGLLILAVVLQCCVIPAVLPALLGRLF